MRALLAERGESYVGVAAGRGRRCRYYACFSRQRYGKDACDGERICADILEAAVLDALCDFCADPDMISRAVAVKTKQVAATTRLHHDEIDGTTAELKKTEVAIERYMLAFEAGSISDDMFSPRVRDLGDRARSLKARRDELEEAAYIAAMDPPAQADLDTLRAELQEIIKQGSDTRRKAVAQAFVHRLVVQAPGIIQPTYLIRGAIPTDLAEEPHKTAPKGTSRAVTDLVDPGSYNTNRSPTIEGPVVGLKPAVGTHAGHSRGPTFTISSTDYATITS